MKVTAVFLSGASSDTFLPFVWSVKRFVPDFNLLVVGSILPPEAEKCPASQITQLQCDWSTVSPAVQLLPFLEAQLQSEASQLILFENIPAGHELAARLAIRQGGKALNDVLDFALNENTLHVHRRIYARNLHAEYTLSSFPVFLCLQNDSEKDFPVQTNAIPHSVISVDLPELSWYQQQNILESDEDGNPLEHADIVLAMGRGMQDPDSREKLNRLAEHWGAAVGATRTAALCGYRSLSDMLGISGILARPKLCIVFGASGAMPFMAGVEKSDILVAINRDPDALIMEQCDYAITDTCENILQALLAHEEEKES